MNKLRKQDETEVENSRHIFEILLNLLNKNKSCY